ncbi:MULTISPECIES: zinc finger-like domain-containing protein [unclassified Pseudomonas]|uniref:zinc finger-like domain-containing protein n=1 Tax=unclassified Pseudomonas TaxID=196821 RepID=UPI0015B443E8|nr:MULTISPECIES: zinc finger-like domain-containing protein [unclassified Pseudomonas]
MNDEKFELTICDLAGSGTYYADIADELRSRDTAQREALARVEAERDVERARGDAAVGDANEAEAQLAEAVGLLGEVMQKDGEGWGTLDGRIESFLARHAQAEQHKEVQYETLEEILNSPMAPCKEEARVCHDCNGDGVIPVMEKDHDGNWIEDRCRTCDGSGQPQEAQGAQAVDFWTWLDLAYRNGSKGEEPKFTKYNMEVAYRARTESTLCSQGAQAGDERAAFEGLAKAQGLSVTRTTQGLAFANGTRRDAGDYIDLLSLVSWHFWQARAALATQPAAEQLWAVHAQGPDDLYAAFSGEEAEAHAAELNALPCWAGISVSAVVIESPWPAVEHWKYLVEQDREHNNAAVGGAEE